MQPHAVALINITAYVKNGHSLTKCRVNVSYDKNKYYDINVDQSSSSLTCQVTGLWGCRAEISLSGTITIRHSCGSTIETFQLSGSSIYSGKIINSSISSGPFEGRVHGDGKQITLKDAGVGKSYTSTLSL
jgi:hypothetical protein